ncbi:hypothetical protein HYH03_013275 [Edaphochlamys debaryana]|uniref:Tyrosine-protein kinase ephrin type A/B receptor-like domain-containing protein n=1 Tax=Edaphochlamys debaryana TaxID=47281 RepID=A0A835XR04_9CHLO|nr:hypothetical protein HYH03_013275 [Edaphochlamys debaryana]|eukprot:KAG2488129.1 hypothetical protein HYH03_013275 [Edaphochlamys debaryana]
MPRILLELRQCFANKCETDGAGVDNCGSCRNVCPTRANAAVRTCSGDPPACGFTCDTGFYDVNGVASDGCEAKKCPAGTFSDTGYYPATSTPEASCSRCPAGTYSSAVGADSAATCTLCPNKFWSAAGAPSCTSCGAGKTTAWKGSDDAGDCVDAAFDLGAWNEGPWGMSDAWYKDRVFDTAARFIWSSLPVGSTIKENEIAVLTRQFEAQAGVPLEIYIWPTTPHSGWPGTNRPVQVFPLPPLTSLHTVTLRGLNAQVPAGCGNPAGVIAGIRAVATMTTIVVTDDTWTRANATAPDAADLVPPTTPPKGFSSGIFSATFGWWI